MLLTDRVRSSGAILANTSRGMRRARFTIAHELGHFLMEWHEFSGKTGFTCSARNLRETREGRRELKQEAQANQFAIGLLAPFHMIDPLLSGDPDLRDGQRLRDSLDLSLEACVRRMIERRSEPLAAIWSKDGVVRYAIRNRGFPFVTLSARDRLPQTSQAFRAASNHKQGFTEFAEAHPMAWTNTSDLSLFEQTRLTANGHAVTLLWADAADDSDVDEDLLPELGAPSFR